MKERQQGGAAVEKQRSNLKIKKKKKRTLWSVSVACSDQKQKPVASSECLEDAGVGSDLNHPTPTVVSM